MTVKKPNGEPVNEILQRLLEQEMLPMLDEKIAAAARKLERMKERALEYDAEILSLRRQKDAILGQTNLEES